MKAPDLTGARFGQLTVVENVGRDSSGSAIWLCRCDCGELRPVAGTGLRAGRNKSCGCASPRFTSKRTRTHMMSGTAEYRTWLGMHRRCSESASGKERRNYFLKGIRVCERWGDFSAFLADMGRRPPGMTVDRIDSSKNYEPSNCRWASYKVQANNTSANRRVTFNGQVMTVAQWAERAQIKPNTLLYRLRRGWTAERALTQPLQRRLVT